MSNSDYNKIISTINSVSIDYTYSPDPNNLICIDTSNNRIGINTLDPEYSLHISGGDIRATNSGFYFIDLTPTYFYQQTENLLDKRYNNIANNDTALVYVERFANPIYLPLTPNGPTAVSEQNFCNNLIQI